MNRSGTILKISSAFYTNLYPSEYGRERAHLLYLIYQYTDSRLCTTFGYINSYWPNIPGRPGSLEHYTREVSREATDILSSRLWFALAPSFNVGLNGNKTYFRKKKTILSRYFTSTANKNWIRSNFDWLFRWRTTTNKKSDDWASITYTWISTYKELNTV